MLFNRKSAIDKIKEQEKIEQEKRQKEIKDLKLACSQVFSDTNGKYVLKFLKKICKWEDNDTNVNHDQVVYDKGRRHTWTILRTVLPKDVLAEIEIYDKDALIN